MKTLTIAIVALLALGCSEPAKKFTLIGFTDAELDVAYDAQVELCSESSYCPLLTGGASTIGFVDHMLEVDGSRKVAVNSHETRPQADIDTIRIFARRELPDWLRRLRYDLLHELGHSAGCRDTGIPETVMNGPELSADHLTPDDLACMD